MFYSDNKFLFYLIYLTIRSGACTRRYVYRSSKRRCYPRESKLYIHCNWMYKLHVNIYRISWLNHYLRTKMDKLMAAGITWLDRPRLCKDSKELLEESSRKRKSNNSRHRYTNRTKVWRRFLERCFQHGYVDVNTMFGWKREVSLSVWSFSFSVRFSYVWNHLSCLCIFCYRNA